MRQFFIYIILIFGGLTFFYFQNDEKSKNIEDKKIHVYASSSFVAKWGPAPALKELFEKQTVLKVEFFESPDLAMTIQKINFENEASTVDVIMGLDQFGIVRSGAKIKWRPIVRHENVEFVNEVTPISAEKNFVPYDWAPVSFVARKNLKPQISSLKDFLSADLKGKIAIEDPRTSTVGLQFLVWIFETMGVDDALKYLKQFNKQVHSFSPNWSSAYGLFKNNQADVVLSYITSPVYHLVEEKDDSFMSLETAEPLPSQVEFAGIPESCKNCDAAEIFVNFLLTKEAQKIIMSKNYMFPVIQHVKEATPFDAIKRHKVIPLKMMDANLIDKWINTWLEIRKNEGT